MFSMHTKVFAALFTICVSGLILSLIGDKLSTDELIPEEAYVINRKENDPNHYEKWKKAQYDKYIKPNDT